MAKARVSVVATDRHQLRLVQLVAAGTAGAYQDPVLGGWWRATPKTGPKQGLNGPGGFVSVENSPIRDDAGEFSLAIPPVGSDGRNNRDRLYFYASTPDRQAAGGTQAVRVPYMPGDEWIEVYRGTNELIASGTPVSDSSQPDGLTLLCRDAAALLKKTRETSSGFWNHSARDVFEHYCNTPDAPIWMADCSHRPLGEIAVGDRVMGWATEDGEDHIGNNSGNALCPATVLDVKRRLAPLVRITFASGRTVRCTPDHQWVVRERQTKYAYGVPRVGDYVAHVIDPPRECPPGLEREAGWLGGMYDGEGSERFISQYPGHNPETYARIGEVGALLGLDLRATPRGYYIGGGRQGYLDFVGMTNPVKRDMLIRNVLGRNYRQRSYRFTSPDRVVSIEADGSGEVVSLTTTTGNYVAWGYASRNCRVWQAVIADDFTDGSQFTAWNNTPRLTTNGRWTYTAVQSVASGLLTFQGVAPLVTTPAGLTATVTGGGSLNGSYGYAVTALSALGETDIGTYLPNGVIASPFVQAVSLSWTARSGATGYRIYRRPINFFSVTSFSLIGTVAAGVTTFVDTSAATLGGSPPTVNSAAGSLLQSTATVTDAGVADHSCWRAEARFVSVGVSGGIGLSMYDPVAGRPVYQLQVTPAAAAVSVLTYRAATTTYSYAQQAVNVAGLLDPSNQRLTPPYTLAIEARERWVYFYLNGQLISVAGRTYVDPANTSSGTLKASASYIAQNTTAQATLDYVVLRKTTPPMNGGQVGDYRLASQPSCGGLSGSFYDMTNTLRDTPTPLYSINANRVDSGPNYTNLANAIPGWFPSALGASQRAFVRWVGSIYLPLATQDVHFSTVTTNAANSSVLWVGRTRKGEAILSTGQSNSSTQGETAATTSVGMRSLLGSVSGWYPIVYEFVWAGINASADASGFTYDVGGAGSVPTPYVLSPYGVFSQQVPAADSHYDTIKTTIAEAFALQWKVEPRALESGSFPGIIVPKVRVGRDTDFVLDTSQATNPSAITTAEDVATVSIAQAQGLGGNSSGSLEAEAFNFQLLGSHPLVLSESENLPATSQMSMFVLQLATLLGLRTSPWQQISADSIGQRQMQDSFPLTGALQEFDWQPGDGLRINLPSIGVVDQTPRAIISLKRVLYPDGMGSNTASFRARPRDFMTTMRRFIRQVLSDRRAFQGQLTLQSGTRAVSPAYSESILPVDLSLVRQAFLIVLSKSDSTTSFNVNINGAPTGQTITTTGQLDVSNYIGRNNGNEPRMLASLDGNTASCQVSYMLALMAFVPTI